jgi:pyruvate,water dikinase
MPWQPLERFRDPSVPKLDNLRRAAAAGLRVPPTWWARARELGGVAPAGPAGRGESFQPPAELGPAPCIIRSGSPTEDRRTTSNAGQLLSLIVRDPGEFAAAAGRVVAALPRGPDGQPLGAVFVQPLVNPVEAGVAFFDGFYYERTAMAGGNQDLTAGQARGEVVRGHLMRAEPWSAWLAEVYRAFGGPGGDPRLDIEFARDADGFVLLQVRPALFPVRRNETVTLANHKETLGDLPSPWIVSALVEGGRDPSFLSAVEPAVRSWEEPYAIELAERAWMNLSLWARLTDHFGLPRTAATRGVGGNQGGPADARIIPGRLLRSIPRLLRGQWLGWKQVRDAERALRRLDGQIAQATDLAALHRATAAGLRLAVNTNFAIAGMLTGLTLLRRLLHVPGSARPVTQEMMEAYHRLAELPDAAERQRGLDAWLARYGHRGPLESDLARPRFAELRDVLLADLLAAPPTTLTEAQPPRRRTWARLFGPLFWMDERREWFRDAMMHRWQRLRRLILAESARLAVAGKPERAEDVFWLRGTDLGGGNDYREAVTAAKERADAVRGLDLPLTATRDAVEAMVARARVAGDVEGGRKVFPGIPLGPAVCEGEAVKADDLTALLAALGTRKERLGPDKILVVPSLEPSWAVVFPRVGGVVAEVGGELSHASILLREAGRPAIVNCADVFRLVRTGDRLRLDGGRGVVEMMDATPQAG